MTLFESAPVTVTLLTIICIISVSAFFYRHWFAALVLHPYSVFRKKWYRVFTADLVHIDGLHLILNVFMLYVFGSDLEELLKRHNAHGSLIFFSIFFVSMVCGNLLVSISHRNDPEYSSAGCSGSIMGCLFAFMLLDPKGAAMNFAFIGPIQNIYVGPLYMILLWGYKLRGKKSLINHDLHFYGALAGILTGLMLHQFMK